MSEPQVQISTPLQYATLQDQPPARPVWLLGPNALAACVPFIPFYLDGSSLAKTLADVMAGLVAAPRLGPLAYALLLVANLLAVAPLVWTIFLVRRPVSTAAERWMAWCLAAWLVVTWALETLFILTRPARYVAAPITSLLVLVSGGMMIGLIWRYRRTFAASLVGLTVACAAMIAFTVCIFLVDSPAWTVGSFVSAMAAACQILGAGVCVRIWRAQRSAIA